MPHCVHAHDSCHAEKCLEAKMKGENLKGASLYVQTQQIHCPYAVVCTIVLRHHSASVDQWSRCGYSHPARHE